MKAKHILCQVSVLVLLLLQLVLGDVLVLHVEDNDDVCLLPKDGGRCRALKPHFHFNSETKRCELFFYGGCGGNGNNFRTLKDCHERCNIHLQNPKQVSVHLRGDHCLLPPTSNLPMACMAFFPRFTFNSKSLECEPYIYGGCGATANLYLSKEECKASCLYGDLTPSFNRPRAMAAPTPRKSSPKFKAAAMGATAQSGPALEAPEDICSLPPITPRPYSCSGFIPKWTYDSKIGSCVEYIYGGCFGTKNLFNSKEECEAKCASSNPAVVVKTPDVCGKTIDKGPCRALKLQFAFNKETNRCEKFIYGGCQGNENRFDSLEDCVNLCGGHEPQEKLDCSAAVCNRQDAAFHRSKGCQPVLKPGECCPSSWDCSAWEERLRTPEKCFWANEDFPRGKYYEVGEKVPEANGHGSCRMACGCAEGFGSGADIICAMPGCYWPQKKGVNCKMLYKDLNSCCASNTKCDEELEELHTCKVDNTTYYAGQKISVKDDPCKVCLCSEGWSGETDDKEYCMTIDCGLNYQTASKLKQGCSPIYKEDACCPIAWVCPKSSEPVEEPEEEAAPKTSQMIICPPGVQIRPGDHNKPPVPPVEPLGFSTLVEARPLPPRIPSDVCLLPRNLGPCEGYEDAWYFDIDSRRCQKFKSGGGSGGNLFQTEDECKKTCKEFGFEPSAGCKFSIGGEDDEAIAVPLIMCLNEHKRFRFNKKTGKCEEFVDWTCGMKVLGYTSMDECEANCLTHEHEEEEKVVKGKEERCNSAPTVGPCRSRLRRFYYDPHVGHCNMFYYGGCGSDGDNSNNFLNEHDCIQTCVPDANLARAVQPQDLDVNSPCKQKGPVQGRCRALIPRFYYDEEKRICRIFFYGGCGGNDNNFANLKDCSGACPVDEDAQRNHLQICELPKQTGDCNNESRQKRFFYNSDNFVCEPFEYTGCGGNENNFETLSHCQLECVLPQTLKTLEENSPQTSVDVRISSIHPIAEDLDTTENEVVPDDPCLEEKAIGMCRAAIRRFHFDSEAKECRKFLYGGCGGNNNNFKSLSECEERCSRHLEKKKHFKSEKFLQSGKLPTNPVCLLQVEVGPCEALKPSYFFNSQTRKCENFVYGGCRGNGNRFSSKEECEAACSIPSQPDASAMTIALPQATRPCQLGNESYNVGDIIRYSNNRCRTCLCLTPPGLSCIEKSCSPIKLIKTGNSVCEPTYDGDSCCETGYTCRPKEDHPEDCSKRICAMFDFMTPPGQTCTSLSDGCCQAGIMCVPSS